MSIATPPKPPISPPPTSAAQQLIDQRIVEACSALWWAELTRTILRMVIAGIALTLAWIVVDQWIYSPGQVLRTLLLFGILGCLVWYVWSRVIPLLGSSIQPEYAARSLERDIPDLHQDLTSYVTLKDEQTNKSLRSRVVRSIGSQAAGRLKQHDVLPEEATGTLRLWIVTACALALLVGYCVASPKNPVTSAARLVAPLADIAPSKRVSIEDVQPGDAEAIAGRMVSVSAKIDGLRDQEEVSCVWDLISSRGQTALRLDTDTNRYVGELRLPHSAQGKIAYVIRAGDAEAGPFHLQVKNAPVVALQSIRYEPPSYTGESPHTSSSGAIKGLDGTRVTILATTNRAVTKANIEFNPKKIGDRVQATAGATEMKIADDGMTLSLQFPLRSARGRSAAVEPENYRIKVWDKSNQTNPEPIVYPIKVIADLPPEISIVLPTRSPQDLPINLQQAIEIHSSDPDYGLKQVSLEIRSGIDLLAEPVLWSDEHGAKGNRVTEYGFRPTRHRLRIGDRVQIVAIAVDNRIIDHDSSVEPNSVRSDPIELRIVASDAAPEEDDPEANGISNPKEQPADDKDKQESSDSESNSGSGEGEKSAGGGSGGSGEGETKRSEGDPQSGQSGNSSGDNDGEGQNSSEQESSGQNSDPSNSQNDSSNGSSGGGSNSGGAKGDSSTDADPGEMSQDDTGEAANENSDGTNKGGKPGQESDELPDSGNDPSKSNSAKQNPSNTESQNGNQPSSDMKDEGDNPGGSQSQNQNGLQNAESNPSDGSQSADPSGEPNSEDGTGSQPPEHDGDAFEKIRDHIEQKRKERESNQGAGSQDSGSEQSGSKQSGSEQSGSQPPNGSNEQQGDSSDPQHEDGSEMSLGDKNRNEPTGENGKQANPQGNHSSSDQSNDESGSQSQSEAESSSTESDPQGSDKKGGEQAAGEKTGDENTDNESEGSGGETQMSPEGNQDQSGSESENDSPQEGTGSDSASDQPKEQSGKQPSGENSSDQNQNSDDSSGDNSQSSKQGDSSSKSGKPSSEGQTPPASDQSPNDSKPQGSQPRGPSTSDTKNSSKTKNPESESNPQSFDGNGSGSEDAGEAGDTQAPDPVNMEYTKKATDMVLDYLEETRDSPDRDLLDKLQWSEGDLKNFTERWQKVREMPATNEKNADRDVTEALESLGLRPPVGEANNNLREKSDSLRSVRDSGNRKPPPPAFRDAFDAFRRSMGKSAQ